MDTNIAIKPIIEDVYFAHIKPGTLLSVTVFKKIYYFYLTLYSDPTRNDKIPKSPRILKVPSKLFHYTESQIVKVTQTTSQKLLDTPINISAAIKFLNKIHYKLAKVQNSEVINFSKK